MIYDINNIATIVVNKYWSVYPYTYRIFVDECEFNGRYNSEMSEEERYSRFREIKAKYYTDAKCCHDEFTGYWLYKFIHNEIG